MKESAWLGIDPGLLGCVSLIYDNGYLLHDYESPERIWEVLNVWNSEFDIKFACLEHILIYPRQEKGQIQYRSGNTINKLPQNVGEYRAFLIALDIPRCEPKPQTWQAFMIPKIPGMDSKSRSLKAARERFGDDHLKFKKDHNRSDSLNLAQYGKIIWERTHRE